ncbi:MAG: TIGR04255 family protein [Candidatus Eremiobacteraeota bacterium]|nr:TIGR04255 family protein [Candidatus Eremiobacteraeota bacterium]
MSNENPESRAATQYGDQQRLDAAALDSCGGGGEGRTLIDTGPGREKFRAAPVQEVVLDIRVEPREGLTVDDLIAATKELSRTYPQITRYEPQFAFGPDETRALSLAQNVPGLLFSKPDGRQFIQVSIDGVTLNELSPYSGWELLRDAARAVFEYYADTCEPQAVTRVGLRYINQLIVLGELFQFPEYLTVFPTVPQALGAKAIRNYFMQVVTPLEDDSATLYLSQSTVPAPQGYNAVLLDLDYRSEGRWAPLDSATLLTVIENLHAKAYRGFLNATTQKYREMIK